MKSLLADTQGEIDDIDGFGDNGKRLERTHAIGISADEVYTSAELRTTVTRHISSLSEAYRNLVMLRDIEGYSIAETAELLGISQASVKTGLHRARNTLKKLLETREV